MLRHQFLGSVLLTGMAVSLGWGQQAKQGTDAKSNANVKPEVQLDTQFNALARGPVHEAFARPFEKNPAPNIAVKQRPPAPIAEEPPPQRAEGKNVQWLPGYWQWDTTRDNYVWVSGMWRNMPEDRRWVAGYWAETADGWRRVNGHFAAAAEKDFQYVATPPACLDEGPQTPAPDDHSCYIIGCWMPSPEGYRWRAGYWADTQADMTWVPARYDWTPNGWIFINGFWDFMATQRGVLFAPVEATAAANAAATLQPAFALSIPSVLDNLFVNARVSNYFFGNFYGQQFVALGLQPMISVAMSQYEPLGQSLNLAKLNGVAFADLRANLAARLSGSLALPPATLAEQLKLQALAGVKAGTNGALVLRWSDLEKVGIKLTALTDQQRAQIQANAQALVKQSEQLGVAASQLRVDLNTVPMIGSQGLAGVSQSLYYPGVDVGGIGLYGNSGLTSNVYGTVNPAMLRTGGFVNGTGNFGGMVGNVGRVGGMVGTVGRVGGMVGTVGRVGGFAGTVGRVAGVAGTAARIGIR